MTATPAAQKAMGDFSDVQLGKKASILADVCDTSTIFGKELCAALREMARRFNDRPRARVETEVRNATAEDAAIFDAALLASVKVVAEPARAAVGEMPPRKFGDLSNDKLLFQCLELRSAIVGYRNLTNDDLETLDELVKRYATVRTALATAQRRIAELEAHRPIAEKDKT